MKTYIIPATLLALISVPQTIAGASPLATEAAQRTHRVMAATAQAGPIIIDTDPEAEHVNVMGRAMPKMPAVPQLSVKKGVVRGYVRDSQGHPLKGAVIGVRSSQFGGFYSGASGKTDARGYYEVKAPHGSGSFYCAAYAMDYGDGLAAFALCPDDGDTDSFVVTTGLVKNWVLMPYGVADRAGVQESPHYSGNYYGGTIILGYHVDSDSDSAIPGNLPAGSVIEITLTPTTPLIDGGSGRVIVIRRPVTSDAYNTLYINNIPIAEYKISAKLSDGSALRLRETGMYRGQAFGLSPKQATGEATLLLKAAEAKPGMVTAAHGSWTEFQINIEKP